MQTTVNILVQARDVDLLPGEPLVITIDGMHDVALAGASKTHAQINPQSIMRRHRRFGLGLSKTRVPFVEVNVARCEAAP